MKAYINDTELRIYNTLVFTAPYQKKEKTQYAIYTGECPVKCRIQFDCKIDSIIVRPLRYGIKADILDEHTVEIELTDRRNFSIEPNGDLSEAFLMFAGEADETEKSDYEHLIYFGPGEHFANVINIDDDSTLVYLDKDAIVNGTIKAKHRQHIAVDGYGVLTMQNYSRGNGIDTSIHCKMCRDIVIKNIVIADSCNWHINLEGCDDGYIDDVKLVSYRGNSDGIDLCGTRNVLVENCFTRVWDDSLVVKGVDTGDVENITFRNCVLWNDFARPMELGVSIRADKMHNIRFENIDVIHSVTGYPIMGIHHGDRAEVYDVHFENINVESTPGAQLFDLRITDSAWNRDTQKGCIHDFYFKNINLVGNPGIEILPYHSRLQGFSEEHSIKNIWFENINLLGKNARKLDDLGVDIYDHVYNVNLIPGEAPYINRVKTKIIPLNFGLREDGLYDGKVKIVFENVSKVNKSGKVRLEVSPQWIADENIEIDFSVKGEGVYEIEKEITLPAGKFAFSLRSNDIDLLGSIGYINLDLCLTDKYENSAVYFFGDSYGHMRKGVQFAFKNDLLLIKSDLLKKYNFVIYTAKPVLIKENQMLFSIEDTNSGEAPAILAGKNGTLLEGPQIGCPEEITYVFKNQPAVSEINKATIVTNITGETYVTRRQLGIDENTDNFWMEIEILDNSDKRYPFTMFASPVPDESAHMFVNVRALQNCR